MLLQVRELSKLFGDWAVLADITHEPSVLASRHLVGVNVAFGDGHVAWFTNLYAALAADLQTVGITLDSFKINTTFFTGSP